MPHCHAYKNNRKTHSAAAVPIDKQVSSSGPRRIEYRTLVMDVSNLNSMKIIVVYYGLL